MEKKAIEVETGENGGKGRKVHGKHAGVKRSIKDSFLKR